jgi:GGDEF domain-containing protein
MRRFLVARGFGSGRAACSLFIILCLARVASAQIWNDPRSRSIVERATARRAQQLADTGLTDYQANARGYVTFLAQLGEGFLTPPKIIKADELELEVYWHAPNLSKQRIVGRRDTLLLPTDIAYHRDHLGIVQNNFPNIIRIGEGDEVRDVPHPLSPVGLTQYDFALADSFAIGSGAQRINVYEIKVRPKNDRGPAVVGAIYIDPAEGQVVRMSFSFTRAALLDPALEDLSIVLENRLVGGRFWLPSRQEVEIRRTGTWLDYPVRGIIRGRWEIGDYRFNTAVPTSVFAGPEYVQAPPAELKRYPWKGNVLDSLPPDVRATTDEDVQRVQTEARQLVRAQALARAQRVTLSARNLSDFARFNRVEGFAIGDGLSKQFGSGIAANVRARYGLDDHQAKGSVAIIAARPSGSAFRIFASRDFRDVGDVAERSTIVNSLAAQEFGSDYTDPFLVRAVGAGADYVAANGIRSRLTASYEWQAPLSVRAGAVSGVFEPTVPAEELHASRVSIEIDRPPTMSFLGTELEVHGELRATFPYGSRFDGTSLSREARTLRGAMSANIERPFGSNRLVTTTTLGFVAAPFRPNTPPQELIYLGGPTTGPGYDYHSIVSTRAFSEHIEFRVPAPFVPFSLGRFGRVPGRGSFAPFVHVIGATRDGAITNGLYLYPSVGAGFLTPFDLLRMDVARGLRNGRWTFSIDVSRQFWSVL